MRSLNSCCSNLFQVFNVSFLDLSWSILSKMPMCSPPNRFKFKFNFSIPVCFLRCVWKTKQNINKYNIHEIGNWKISLPVAWLWWIECLRKWPSATLKWKFTLLNAITVKKNSNEFKLKTTCRKSFIRFFQHWRCDFWFRFSLFILLTLCRRFHCRNYITAHKKQNNRPKNYFN